MTCRPSLWERRIAAISLGERRFTTCIDSTLVGQARLYSEAHPSEQLQPQKRKYSSVEGQNWLSEQGLPSLSLSGVIVALMTTRKPLNRSPHSPKNFICCSQPVDADKLPLTAIVVEERSGLPLKTLNPASKNLRIVVLAFAAEHPPHEFLARHREFNHAIEAHGLTFEKLIQSRSLPQRSRKTVEQAALAAVRLHQSLAQHANDQLVGHELPLLHEAGRLLPFASLLVDSLPEHLAGGEMGNVQVLHEPLALRAFAGSRWPDKDNPHEYGPLPTSGPAARRGGVANVVGCRTLQGLDAGDDRHGTAQDFSSKPL